MKSEKGFTLVEFVLLLVLIAIVGITASPLLNQTTLFQERFFIDEFSNLLRFANRTATASGCDIAVKEVDQNKIGLFMRQNCLQDDYVLPVMSPFILDGQTLYQVSVPKKVILRNLPLYIDKNGKVTDSNHQWQKEITLSINQHRLIIDGTSGFVHEKF